MTLLLNIPLFMVVSFLLLTLVVGLYFSQKTTTLREYAVGNKQFATATLVATVLATAYGGGGLVRAVEQVHHNGLYWVILLLLGGGGLDIWVISPLALRMGPFMKHLSMAETLGQVYGKYTRVITALSSICNYTAGVAIQINVMSRTISMCVNSANQSIITLFATLILIAYSTFGGIRSVTFTDVLQFVTFSVIIPLLAYFMFVKTGKPVAEIISTLQGQEKFQFSTLFHFDMKLGAIVALILSSLVSYIEPTTMQRVYMSSGPIQAQKVFLHASLFKFIIKIFIVLIGLFTFVSAPDLPIKEIWDYIMANIPSIFKGGVAISLLAMTMSTADSKLNACAVMVSHDIMESVRGLKKVPYSHQLWLAKLSALMVGLLAMILAFYCNDLLELLKLSFDLSIPIVTAPFILAIFGFRGTSRTALIGIATGTLTILAWNQWIEPTTKIDGAFPCMLANGLAMMAAHYLLPQPEDKGWIEPDDQFKQIQQAKSREKARRKEAFKNAFINVKESLSKLQTSNTELIWMGIYITTTTFLTCCIVTDMDRIYWPILQIIIGVCLTGYATFVDYETAFKKEDRAWIIGLCWLISLIFCLSGDAIWNWWQATDPLFTTTLSFAHLAVTLFVLPAYLGIRLVIATLLVAIYPIYCMGLTLLPLLPLLVVSLLVLAMLIYLKVKIADYLNLIFYLKGKQKQKKAQRQRQSAYSLHTYPSNTSTGSEEDGSIFDKVIDNITESISFLDHHTPLYKQDFQNIINKFSEWALYLKKKLKAKNHMLLLPTEITLDELIYQLEVALAGDVGRVPRLFIEQIDSANGAVSEKIICDVNQMIHLLVTAVLRVANLDHPENQFIKIQLHTTQLKFEKSPPINNVYPLAMVFPSIAIVVSNSTTPSKELPKVESYYEDNRDDASSKEHNSQIAPERIDFDKKTIEHIIKAHFGYLEYPDGSQNAMLLVLPRDVNSIRNEIIAKLPTDCLISERPITPKEQGDSIMVLMAFHDYVCQVSEVDPAIISGILLLLRQRYGVKRHASGQLFYVRAVGIAKLIAKWIFHSPKPIYASLLYDLVGYTRLPLSYIKANYNLGVYVFVQNVLGVDKYQEMELSLLYVGNRFKEALSQAQPQLAVLYIKLAERLYDLRHAEGYTILEEVKYMAKETLAVDIELAKQYLDPEIAAALAIAAQKALELYNRKTTS